jgi:hypothetical protein
MLLLWPATRADVEVVFLSGDTIRGTDVRRDGDDYALTTFDGSVIKIPMSDVLEVRLSGTPEDVTERQAVEEEDDEWWPSGGLTTGKPEVLAGEKVTPPKTSEQLEVFGEPSKFAEAPLDPTWRPKSALTGNVLKEFESTWTESSYDPNWEPENAYSGNTLDENRSTWQEAPYDPTWVPEDAFAEEKEKRKSLWS